MLRRLILILLCSVLAMTVRAAQDDADKSPEVTLHTSDGDITIKLNRAAAPITVKNFLAYVRKGHYAGTIFHRVIADFMIQGGGFDSEMNRVEVGQGITNEADNGLVNARGTLAMARTSDPHSASAQFFINLKDNNFLNHTGKNARGWGYAVFGEVVSGMDVVDQIGLTETGRVGGMGDVPLEPVIIISVSEGGAN